MKLSVVVAFFLTLAVLGVQAQKISFSEKRSTFYNYVKGEDFEGVIFSKDFIFPFLENQYGDKRFTPSIKEVEAAEKILLKKLKKANTLQLNQGSESGPIIHENLKSYARQYYGYLTEKGNKIVFISFLLKANYHSSNNEIPNWLKGAVVVLNGGSNYWQVQTNLKKSTLFGLQINDLDKDPVD